MFESRRKVAGEVVMGKKIFLSVTIGVLSLAVCYIAILVVAGVMAEKFPVKLPSKSMLTTSWTDWAYASGTWTIENEKSGAPFQTSEIFCSRQTKSCDFVTAEVVFGTLKVSRDSHQIQKWDQNEIVATNDDPTCFRYVYSINRLTEQVSGLRIKKPLTAANSEVCAKWSSEQLQLRLVDGGKWYWEEWGKSSPNLFLVCLPGVICFVTGLFFIWRRNRHSIAA